MIASTAATFPIPLLVRQIIDGVIPGGRVDELWWWGAGIVLLVVIQAGLAYATQFLTVVAQEKLLFDVQTTLVDHVLTLPQAFFQDRQVGYLMARVRSDPAVAKDFFFGALSLGSDALFLAAGAGLLLYLDWRLALLALSVLPALALASKRLNARMGVLAQAIQEGDALVSQELGEGLCAALPSRLLGLRAWIVEKVSAAMDSLQRANVRTNTFGALAGGMLTFITGVGPMLLVIVGAYQVIRGQLTLGTVIAFMSLLAYLFGPTQSMIITRLNLQRAKVAAERIFELLDEPPEPDEGLALAASAGSVALTSVSFTYPNGKVALQDVSLRAGPGEWVALVGPTGSGKSTLLSLVVRLFPLSAGTISIDGRDVGGASLSSLRREVLLVTQDVFLFSGTVLENIRLGDPRVTDNETLAVADALGADAFIRELPEGYQTVVGERGAKLSGGQRQMIALARAVLRRPKVLLLDEATAALDSETEGRVLPALRELLPATTVILAAHRLSTVRATDRVVVLKDGCLVQEGRHDELIAAPGEYREVLAEQLVGAKEGR
jgi:ABC-type bacteriocin/lantibiotic exporter with double-glycine peptidase domain